MRSIADLYAARRSNSLNLIRLALATLVIFGHSYAITGTPYPPDGFKNILGGYAVNGFFAISGFLIYQSWIRRPSPRAYLTARVLRIYPAFWVCLVVTAAIFAPLNAALTGFSPVGQLLSVDSLMYVVKNASLAMLQWNIGETPAGVAFPEAWNGSLWTLAWEFLCYIGLLVLGMLGMAKRRWMLPTALALSVAMNILLVAFSVHIEVLSRIGRFSMLFLMGAVVAAYAHRIPANWGIAIVGVLLSLGSYWLPFGGVIQAPAIAIGLIALGGLFNPDWAKLPNDLSYGVYIYGFPVQQVLASTPLNASGILLFSLAAIALTFPLAAASWFWIEKPALRLRKKIAPKTQLSVVT